MISTSSDAALDFEETYAGHRLALLRLALLLTGSRDHAEDVVQSVFATAYPRWESIAEPLAYLKRAVVNASADVHRRRFRDRLATTTSEPVTADPEIDETWAVLVRLPARQRAVVVLHFYEDLPLVEIAATLGRPAATIRSDLHRALRTLKKELA